MSTKTQLVEIQTEAEIAQTLSNNKPLHTTIENLSFTLKVEEYSPLICTAIHAGNKLCPTLQENCTLTDLERLQEEDPFTDKLIENFPVTITVHDSRYEYDLNRHPEQCIYQSAWDKSIWHTPLTETQKQKSLNKYDTYYRILNTLIENTIKQFGYAIIFDLHTYNYQTRNYHRPPLFEISTAHLDFNKWQPHLEHFEQALSKITLPSIETDTKRCYIFPGSGHQATHVANHFTEAFHVPLEIKKVFMDEKTGTLFQEIYTPLEQGLKQAVWQLNDFFKITQKNRLMQ